MSRNTGRQTQNEGGGVGDGRARGGGLQCKRHDYPKIEVNTGEEVVRESTKTEPFYVCTTSPRTPLSHEMHSPPNTQS